MTPHIEAKKEDIAKVVLMPGDPLRAEFITEKYLKNVKKVNSVRNMLMFTGEYKGVRVSVCGSGMGVPSIGIYSYELFKFYDVDTIIRVGSAGAYSKELKTYDVVLATEAYSDSKAFSQLVANIDSHVTYPSSVTNEKLLACADTLSIQIQQARVHSSEVFYSSRPLEETIKVTEAKCVEMEATGLFSNAKATGKNAACILSISDHLITGESTSAKQRQTTFDDMIKVALESIL
ncbi:MAG: purine-nucleoside phosphorylase [Sulfurimonas sp.]|nr:purine-nucleoside phosphorylase [Sulfurimonas sp.]